MEVFCHRLHFSHEVFNCFWRDEIFDFFNIVLIVVEYNYEVWVTLPVVSYNF